MSSEDGKLYFPVENVKLHDLFDWSTRPLTVCKPTMTRGKVQKIRNEGCIGSSNEHEVALFRLGTSVYATDEKCPHAGGPIATGDIEVLPDKSLCVHCPWHHWRFSLNTGQIVAPEGMNVKLPVYPTKVDCHGTIWVGFDKFHDSVFKEEYLDKENNSCGRRRLKIG